MDTLVRLIKEYDDIVFDLMMHQVRQGIDMPFPRRYKSPWAILPGEFETKEDLDNYIQSREHMADEKAKEIVDHVRVITLN